MSLNFRHYLAIVGGGEGAGTSDKRYLHADERGSIIALSNTSGAVTQINAYDEFGIPQAKLPSGTSGSTATASFGRFGYTGQAWFPEIGLYHYKARTYSPTLGRFLQTDPIGYGDGMNFYNYVGGDPVNKTDPSGLSIQTPARFPRSDPPRVVRLPGDIVVEGRRPRTVATLSDFAIQSRLEGGLGNGGAAAGSTRDNANSGGGEGELPNCGSPGADPNNCEVAIVVTANATPPTTPPPPPGVGPKPKRSELRLNCSPNGCSLEKDGKFVPPTRKEVECLGAVFGTAAAALESLGVGVVVGGGIAIALGCTS